MKADLKVKLLSHTPDAERLVATAAKLCYSNSDIDSLREAQTEEKVQSFLKMLVDMGHESPVEHVSFTFAVEGVSRALTHQLVRHRIASYSQQSQRYVGASQFSYIVPPAIDGCPEAREIYINQMESAQESYNLLVQTLLIDKCKAYVPYGVCDADAPDVLKERNLKLYKAIEKQCYEDARYVLPNAAETKIILTMNVRTLLNFLQHRCCDRAQWEIRALAEVIYKLCKGVAPTLFAKAGPKCAHGRCPEGQMSCGRQLEKKQMYS